MGALLLLLGSVPGCMCCMLLDRLMQTHSCSHSCKALCWWSLCVGRRRETLLPVQGLVAEHSTAYRTRASLPSPLPPAAWELLLQSCNPFMLKLC